MPPQTLRADTMARRAGCEPVYEAVQRWVDAALHKDDSLFTPGHPIWSLNSLYDFRKRILDDSLPASGGFYQRFELQLVGAPPETIQLAAEILYVYFLIANQHAIRGTTKRQRIREVIGWADTALNVPDNLNDSDNAIDVGILNPGAASQTTIHAQVQMIAELALHWKQMPDSARTRSISDPWSFLQEVRSIQTRESRPQSEALLHLVHPDTFEPSTTRHKELIRLAYESVLDDRTDDVDRDVLEIRNRLTGVSSTYDKGFDFYSPDIVFVWHSGRPRWERFIRWGYRFVDHETFDELEIDFKLQPASRIRNSRLAFESGSDDWLALLKEAFRRQTLVPYFSFDSFLKWCTENEDDARNAFRAMWHNETDIEEAIRGFSSRFPTSVVSGVGTRARLISFLAMAIDPNRYPIYGRTLYNRAYDLVKHPRPGDDADEASVYSHALGFLDRTLKEAGDRGIRLQDRLYAQSLLWSIFSTDAKRKKVLPEAERRAFHRFISVKSAAARPPEFEDPITHTEFRENQEIEALRLPEADGGSQPLSYTLSPTPPAGLTFDSDARTLSGTPTAEQEATTYTYTAMDEDGATAEQTFSITVTPETLDDLATRLFWDAEHLRDIQRLIEHKQQVVFYGPPGTGKTYVAMQLARHFAGAEGSTDLVQFHPSYAYEDFVEGFRPSDQKGQPGFQLREGPLKRIAKRARDNPDAKHVIVIDEINRGNVARVFGELYFLLEYRGPDHAIYLQYSYKKFSLPDNLWFIATMNTADRSIALVDAALRRRFHFVPFFPDRTPVDGLLSRWLKAHKPELLWVVRLLDVANGKLRDRHQAIGPSHFIRKDLNEEWVERIWDYSIIPYIEEQLFGQEDRLAEFEYVKLRAEVQSADTVANGDGDAASPAS